MAIAVVPSIQSCGTTRRTATSNSIQTETKEQAQGEAASFKLNIRVKEGYCFLSYDGPLKGEVETNLLAPCEFLRDPDGKVRHVERTNPGVGSYSVIVLIGGPPADRGHSDKYMKSCGSESQTISLSPRGIKLGGHGNGMDLCPTRSFDEKLFTAESARI